MKSTCWTDRRARTVVILAVAAIMVLALLPRTASAKVTLVEKVGDRETKLQIYGFGQLEMRGGDGQSAEGGLYFKAQRLRVGFNYFAGNMASKLFLDFNQSHTADDAGLPKMIKDAFIAYRWSNSAFIRLGMIKTPLGMSFTVPGWNLDIVERQGLDKGLVLERDFGLMLSGRLIGQESYAGKKQMKTNGLEMGTERQGYGFGYDIGVFNPAGRSSAVVWNKSQLGDALAYAGRLHYDYGPELHVEGAYAVSEKAAGTETSEDYSVYDFGVASELDNMELKAEYISGHNVKGVKDFDQDTLALTFGYYFSTNFEAVIKHYQSSMDKGSLSADLGNTYLGLNFFIDPLTAKARDGQRHRLMFNYILASGDTDTWAGVGGYKDDGWVLQYQYKF